MLDVGPSQINTATPKTAQGGVKLAFRQHGAVTTLDVLHQSAPCRVFFPHPEADDPILAVLVNISGGIVGGDHLASRFELGPGATATITTQAAEKIYRSIGPDCRVVNDIACGWASRLEWLPQETILFDGARLDRRLNVALAEDARFLGVETVFFGRSARGEAFNQGHLRDDWAVRVGGRLVWNERVLLSGDIAQARQRPFGYGDAAGYATIVLAGAGAGGLLEQARVIAAASVARDAGCSLVNDALILRFMDADAAQLRSAVARSVIALRQVFLGLPPRLPRAWMI